MNKKLAVILVGHGGVPKDIPRELIKEGREVPIRNWPRTRETDPYKYGLEDIAAQLQGELGQGKVVTAYNEFCAPSLEDAIGDCVNQNYTHIKIITTMYTRGGIHSETEIPEIVNLARKQYPQINIEYVWPFENSAIAKFLARHLLEEVVS